MEIKELAKLELAVEASRLTDEEIKEWKQHPATKAYLLDLYRRKLEGMAAWAQRVHTRETMAEGAVANAEALGGMRLLQVLIEDLEEVKK